MDADAAAVLETRTLALLDALADLDQPRYHAWSANGRILCGGKQYADGFSPCQLSGDWSSVITAAGEDGIRCTAYGAAKRLAVKHAARRLRASEAAYAKVFVGESMR